MKRTIIAHGKMRSVFVFSFPILLGALFLIILLGAVDYLEEKSNLARKNEWLKRVQIYLARVQGEYSLSLQVEKEFRSIMEKFNRTAGSEKSGKMDQLAPLLQSDLPPDLGKLCRTWAFNRKGQDFVLIAKEPFMGTKKKAMERVFTALFTLSESTGTESTSRNHERFITGVFGENSAPEYLATNRIGRLTSIIFEGRQSYVYWQKLFAGNTCIGGFMSLFPGEMVENREFALQRLAQMIYDETDGQIVAAFALSALIENNLNPVLPATIRSNPAAARNAGELIFPAWKNASACPPRQLLELRGNWLFHDTIADESPYMAFMISKDQVKNLQQPFSPGMVMFALVAGWSVLFWRKWHRRSINLGFAFRMLFFMTGMLPVVLLTIFGLEMIDQANAARINTRVQAAFKQLGRINQKSEDLVSLADLLIKDLTNDQKMQNLLTDASKEARSRGFALLTSRLEKHDFALSYLLLMQPGQASEVYANTSENATIARYHVEYYAMSANALNKVLTFGQPDHLNLALTTSQRTMLNAFGGNENDSTRDIFLNSLNRVTGFTGGQESKHLLYSAILTNDDRIKAYIVVGMSITSTILEMITEQLQYAERNSDDVFVCVSRDNSSGQKVFPAHQQKFFGSLTGQDFKKFLEAAASSNYQMQLQRGENIFIYEPLLKVKAYYAGAMINVLNIIRERDLKKILLMILVALLSGVIYLLSATVSKLMIEPTRRLAEVFTEVAGGNFEQSFNYPYRNELGELAMTTGKMILGLKQRKLLGKFVSKTFDNEILDTTNRDCAQEMHGIILFSDIRSFTTLSEEYPADQIGLMLNHHLKEMVEVINSHGGHIEQFIGDAIVAFFPGNGRNACYNAICSAREMMLQHNAIQLMRKKNNQVVYDIGIGLEYGLVMAGIIKSGSRSEHVVIGQARVKAEEYESSSKQGRFSRIIVGRSFSDQVPDLAKSFVAHTSNSFELASLEKPL